MDIINLTAQKREEASGKVQDLREQGKVPAVLYGHGVKNLNLVVERLALEKVLKQAGESTLVDLSIEGDKVIKVLLHDVQLDHITNRIIHIDLYAVNMTEKITAEIALEFTGEAPAVKELGGILVTSIHSLKVECLPQYLVHEIKIDLSGLKTLDDVVHVKDIKLPENVITHHDINDVVVSIQPPRTEKEMADLESKPEEKIPEAAAEVKPEAGAEEEK
ncbi:MAG: 50S ribosomal protein L25 [Candidatus Buchananbacteria bacterium]